VEHIALTAARYVTAAICTIARSRVNVCLPQVHGVFQETVRANGARAAAPHVQRTSHGIVTARTRAAQQGRTGAEIIVQAGHARHAARNSRGIAAQKEHARMFPPTGAKLETARMDIVLI